MAADIGDIVWQPNEVFGGNPTGKVTKGNKFAAKTASNCNLRCHAREASNACIYQRFQAICHSERVATLTGFEPVLPP